LEISHESEKCRENDMLVGKRSAKGSSEDLIADGRITNPKAKEN